MNWPFFLGLVLGWFACLFGTTIPTYWASMTARANARDLSALAGAIVRRHEVPAYKKMENIAEQNAAATRHGVGGPQT